MSLSTWIGPLLVEALDQEAGCFQVHSGPNTYRVDISYNHCVGRCGCESFSRSKCAKERDRIKTMPDQKRLDRFRCKHIKAVHTAIGLTMVDEALRLYYMNMTKEERNATDQP